MTCRALQGCGLIEEHSFAGDEPNRIVTALTFHALVAALQRKLRALVVIECGRHPSLRGVALRARNFLPSGDELAAMRIGMALLAPLRRSLELDFLLTWSWFVATVAGHCPMSPEQREFRLAVVEALDVYPRFRVVACFAAKGSAIRPAACHPIVEFSMVRIGVAGRATAIFKMERQDFVGRVRHPRFVAVVAGNGYVRAS